MKHTTTFFKFFAVICISCWMVSCGDDSGNSKLVENTSELCKDGVDNDNNGKTDCQEDSCKEFIFCQSSTDLVPENTEALCKDGIDNDNNGKKDCQEDSCKTFDSCQPPAEPVPENTEALCKDGIDNDNNGKTDCQEDSCKNYNNCKTSVESKPENTKELCSDGLDNDNNGYKDCREDSCKQFDVCKDENGNYMRDSEEPGFETAEECIKYSECSSGFCDSFIGKCSVKCTDSSQCISGFICRPDGRCAAEAFETVWRTTDADTKIVFTEPELTVGECDFVIDWGDGSATEKWDSCPTTEKVLQHIFAKPGDYHIKVTGKMTHWLPTNYHNNYSADKLIEVISFGPVGLHESAFGNRQGINGSPNITLPHITSLASVIDIPDATLLGGNENGEQTLDEMFNSSQITSGVAKWDISRITSLRSTFAHAEKYNEDLNRWDTSNVTNMSGTFVGGMMWASSFKGDISTWDTSKVTTMHGMFNSSIFEGDISKWDTSNVTDMSNMFEHAYFNGDISKWNTSKVTTMHAMFMSASFNSDISDWDTSNVTDMGHMFWSDNHFNQDLNRWDVRKVKNFAAMFRYCFDFSIAPKSWNVQSDAALTLNYDPTGTNKMFERTQITCAEIEEMLQLWEHTEITAYDLKNDCAP